MGFTALVTRGNVGQPFEGMSQEELLSTGVQAQDPILQSVIACAAVSLAISLTCNVQRALASQPLPLFW